MKFKKLFLFFLLFTGIIGCGCFNAPEEWNIENFEAFVVDKNNQSPVNGIIEGDSLTLEIFFEATFVETFQNPLHGLLNAAWALSCEDPGHLGLEDKVEQFIITSNTEFNEVPIGDPLNEFILTRRNQLISEWISESED